MYDRHIRKHKHKHKQRTGSFAVTRAPIIGGAVTVTVTVAAAASHRWLCKTTTKVRNELKHFKKGEH